MKQKHINIAGRYLKKFKRLGWLLALALIGGGWWQWANWPVNSRSQTETAFVVPQGQATKAIAQRLKQEKLIRSTLAFRILVEMQGKANRLQAGEFQLNQSLNLQTILANLTHGSVDFWITFPEGLRVEEYAERVAEKSIVDKAALILAAKPFEGQLFPDTYLIPQTASVGDMVSLLTKTFAQKSPTQDKQIIIIASLIEREARHDEDRRLVSSVIHNRLKLGMALQLDATVQYLLGKPGDWWPKALTRDNLRQQSPFNTYLNVGLPPAPIANPGLASLKAAMNPAETDYLYYVSDSSGYNHYGSTLAEHEANIVKYLPLDN